MRSYRGKMAPAFYYKYNTHDVLGLNPGMRLEKLSHFVWPLLCMWLGIVYARGLIVVVVIVPMISDATFKQKNIIPLVGMLRMVFLFTSKIFRAIALRKMTGSGDEVRTYVNAKFIIECRLYLTNEQSGRVRNMINIRG